MICPTCKQSIHCPVCASDLPSAAPAVPLTDDMAEAEFVSRGDDKGQGLHPYWKDAFREGFNFARTQLSAAPAVPRSDEFACPYCFDQGAAPAVPLTDEQFADIVAEASLAVDLAANPLKLLAFARAVLSAAPAVREPLTVAQANSVLSALMIARRYVLTNPEQHACVAHAINIFKTAHDIGGGGK